MNVFVVKTIVEFGPSVKNSNANIYRVEVVLAPNVPLLISLLVFFIYTLPLQLNHIIPADQCK